MRRLGEFELRLDRFARKRMPVEVLVDTENTTVVLDCRCCEELLANKLPGGILIPIASALKGYFEALGMRNIEVNVSGVLMRRTYRGIIDQSHIHNLKTTLENAVSKFGKKRKK
ncbi:MAG: hypothetical protein ACFFAY_06575 [Promethearchaeota archaeon]